MGINIHTAAGQIEGASATRPLDLPAPSHIASTVTIAVVGPIALCMTIARLWIRRDRYWWDDAWAFFSLLNLFVQTIGVIIHIHDPSKVPKHERVTAYYLMAMSFYTVIWSARTSILFSIIRIDPDPHTRRRLRWVAAAFIGAIGFFIAQILWVCEPEPTWKDLPSPQCHLTKQVAICQLVSDIIADSLLIALPLRLIHGMRDTRLRRRIMFIFSTSIVTTVVSLVHAIYIIRLGGKNVLITALVELSMSLTVANVPVVVTALTRAVGRDSSAAAASEDPDRGPRWTTMQFGRVKGQYSAGAGIGGASAGAGNAHPITHGTIMLTTLHDSDSASQLDGKDSGMGKIMTSL
ncbi:hypothetical protein FA95DRAFT_1495059 [Auriscalpium vulgare]|uniref:Uncharacterized protein n=1 Tax=Auriscalpium vulgare TaxID=40419 RepID=A0ACB8RPB4_9AGAM|nr:hypothetical protein FA95DRAFT_1495059 [Auriscalpium vulgare]